MALTLGEDVIGLTMLVAGLFICFFGAKYFKHIVFFVGFVAASLFTHFLVGVVWGWFGGKIDVETRLFISMTLGAMAGIACVLIYKAAVFTVGSVGGVVVAQVLFRLVLMFYAIPQALIVQISSLILGAVIGGYLAFKFVEFILKGVTAFIGAFMFASGTAYFIQKAQGKDDTNALDYLEFFANRQKMKDFSKECDAYCIICVILWMTMTLSGAYVQYRLHKAFSKDDFEESVSKDDDDSDYSDEYSDYSDDESYFEPKKKSKKASKKEMKAAKKAGGKSKKQSRKNDAVAVEMVTSKSVPSPRPVQARQPYPSGGRGSFQPPPPAGRPPSRFSGRYSMQEGRRSANYGGGGYSSGYGRQGTGEYRGGY